MDDKDRQLLTDVLHQAGTAGIQGFSYIVTYKVLDGITGVIGFALAIAGGLWVLRRLMAWKPKDDDAYLPRGVGMVVVCACLFGFLCGVMSSITEMVAPQGAAIIQILHK